MKTVRTYRNWLRRLFAAGFATSLALSAPIVRAQDGAMSYGRTPWDGGATGGASGVIDSNRRGLGVAVRAGHIAGDTVGRTDSISHLSGMPYVNFGNGLLFGDARLGLGNEGGLTWAFGSGYRYYFSDVDAVLGVNGYFASDELTQAQFQQWGVGAEILAHQWEARGNIYRNIDDTSELVGVRADQNSVAFQDYNLIYDRIDRYVEALEGFDAEIGMLLPGELAEQFDVRVFGGGYYYEGENVDQFAGWSGRVQADIANWLELGLKVADDEVFNTTVAFNATVHFGGFTSQEHTRRSSIQRLGDPVRRNMNVASTDTDIRVPGQIARDPNTGLPLEFVHVNSNYIGISTGTVDQPFSSLSAAFGFAPAPDIIFTHAGSVFSAAPDNTVILSPGQQLVGEGQLPSTIGPRSIITTVDALDVGPLILPQSPTLAAAGGALSAPELIGTAGSGANMVTLADDSVFSGFILTEADNHAIFSNGVSDALLRDLLIRDTRNGSGVRIDNSTDLLGLANVSIEHDFAGNLAPAFHVNGGTGTIIFGSTSQPTVDPAFGQISSSVGSAVLIENMTGGLVGMSGGTIVRPGTSSILLTGSTIDHTGGTGITVQDNNSRVTIDNANVANSTGAGISVLRSGGQVAFDTTLRNSITIDNPALQGILIQDMLAGSQISFRQVDITNRNAEGIEVATSAGTVLFSNNVTIDIPAVPPANAAISIHDLASTGSVQFNDLVTITGGGGPGVLLNNNVVGSGVAFLDSMTIGNAVDTIDQGIVITDNFGTVTFGNLASTIPGSTVVPDQLIIDNRIQEGILITGSGGTILFNTITTIQNPQISGSSAIDMTDNVSGVMAFNVVNVQGASGRVGGGAGVHLENNGDPFLVIEPEIRFGQLNIDTVPIAGDGAGLFGLNNASIEVFSGTITAIAATAVDIQNSGINIELTEVNSAASADNGIRLVDTNFEDRNTFTVTGDTGTLARGTGGQIDSAANEGVRLENAGQVTLRSMLILDNDNGIIVENGASSTSGAATPLLPDDDQFLHLVLSNVEDNNFRGLFGQNLHETIISASTFLGNGDDPTVATNVADGEAILLEYLEPLNTDPNNDEVGEFDNPYEVQIIAGSDIQHETDDGVIIRNTTTTAALHSHVNVRVLDSEISLIDTVDPDTTEPGDTALLIDWNGPADIILESNLFRSQHENQTIVDIRSNFLTRDDELLFDIVGNTFISTSANQDLVPNVHLALNLDSFGFVNSGNINGNTIDMTGGGSTGMDLTFASSSDIEVSNNTIFERTDDGTGILFRSVSEPSSFTIEGNQIGLADDDFGLPEPGQGERGIIFQRVLGVVNLFGRTNNIVIADTPFAIPAGTSNGQIIVNGQAVP